MFTILEIFRDSRYYPKFVAAVGWLVLVHLVGIAGFTLIGGEKATLVDSLYMTFTTVATIGFGEIYDMTGMPGARIFTMFIAFFGIGGTWYLFSTFTAFVLETNLNQAYRRRRMLKQIAELQGHYIV